MTGADGRDPLERVAEDFLARVRRGEAPTLEEYAAKHPQMASEIRDLLPAMVEVDRLARQGRTRRGADDEGLPAPGGHPGRFGPYSIVRRLGTGGMGVVYEAFHPDRRRAEALKVLKGGLGNVPEFVERFRREVQAMANMTHDHVVRLYDSGQVGEDLYYTMPLLHGTSLGDLVREVRATGEFPPAARANGVLDRYRLPPVQGQGLSPEAAYARRTAAALVGVADALAAMHGRDILHRDIKPGNLMIDENGRVLVADFGLVRWGEQKITRTGQTLGTPAYMSPEQVISDGKEPDGRTDVYALGATLFELLTLRPPHEGDTGLETIRRKLARQVDPVRSINPSVPQDLETLVGRCLERRREDRYPTAAMLRDDLANFVRGEPVRMKPVSRAVRALHYARRNGVLLGAIAIGIAGASSWYFMRPTRLTVSAIPSARLLLDGREIGTTPVAAYRITPGVHEIRLERERFATFVRIFEVGRGSTFELERGLQALDPADPETLRIVAAAAGLQITGVSPERTRSAEEPLLTVLFPRGRVREAPRLARLWASGPAEGFKAVLERAEGGRAEVLAEYPIPPAIRRMDLAIPEPDRARMKDAGTYRIRIVDAGGRDAGTVEFVVLAAADRDRVDAELRRLGRDFEPRDPVPEYLRVEYLLGQRLYEEAYDRAVALQDGALRNRRETARAALSVLEAAGLKDRGWWATWVEMYLDAEK